MTKKHFLKRSFIPALLALSLTVTMFGCRDNDDKNTNTDPSEHQTENRDTEGTKDAKEAEDSELSRSLAGSLRENFPKTDGSTSAIPLDGAVRTGIFGITQEEAEKTVEHTTSHDSYYNLLDGKCDFVFCHLLSEEQYEAATKRGISVELTPIAREGFIFLINKNNPVDSLTVEQIKEIYSGKITNWKDVGGEDMPIIAYQRNIDSGSQNYMRVFMGDTELMDAPTALRPGGMDTLVDAVASYDGKGGSIGYSVYSYVGGMYDADGGVKILKVNGVLPTFETIADGTYACTGYNYAVIRSDEEENSPARKLLAYILTSEGQKSIANTGYFAPLNPTSNIDITIRDFNLMTSVGAGKEICTPCAWYYHAYFPTVNYQNPDITKDGYLIKDDRKFYVYGLSYPVTGKEALDEQIKTFFETSVDEIVSLQLESDSIYISQYGTYWMDAGYSAINGYISVFVNRGDGYIKSAVWDLETGKRLSLPDLFTKGTAFVGSINSAIQARIDYVGVSPYDTVETKCVFEGLEAGFDNFRLDTMYTIETNDEVAKLTLLFNPDNNRYFDSSVLVSAIPDTMDGCLLTEARDMSSYTDEQYKAYWKNGHTEPHSKEVELETEEGYFAFGKYRYTEIKDYKGSDKINAAILAYVNSVSVESMQDLIFSQDTLDKALIYYEDYFMNGYGIENPTYDDLGHNGCLAVFAEPNFFGNRYVAINYRTIAQYGEAMGFSHYGTILNAELHVYDLDTGDEVPADTVLINKNEIRSRIGTTEDTRDYVLSDVGELIEIKIEENMKYLMYRYGDCKTVSIGISDTDLKWFPEIYK